MFFCEDFLVGRCLLLVKSAEKLVSQLGIIAKYSIVYHEKQKQLCKII